jgi:hypothetical protein
MIDYFYLFYSSIIIELLLLLWLLFAGYSYYNYVNLFYNYLLISRYGSGFVYKLSS